MKLDIVDIKRLLDENFSGNIVYMPIHRDDSPADRPVAQLMRHPQIPENIDGVEPKSLIRGSSALHLKGLLHIPPSLRGRP